MNRDRKIQVLIVVVCSLVAVKNFSDNRYSLDFRCGEVMNVAIDPVSGEASAVAKAPRRECLPSQAAR